MIYQPRNVQPSNTSVDGSKDNVFTMEAQTNYYISAYQLLISDFDNEDVYIGDKVELNTKAYNGDVISIPVEANTVMLSNGTNYKWRVKLYQPTADMLITYGLVQQTSTETNIYTQPNINIREGMTITINGQTQVISLYDVDTGVAVVSTAFSKAPDVGAQYIINSDFIETVPDYIVYARETPTVSINNIPSSLTLKYHTFQGVYNQNDNVPIVYHQFDLYLKNNDGSKTLIDTSGKIYSANLTYTYNSFRTGNTYAIQMTVENDMGIVVSTDLYSFNVSYDIVEYLQQPQATLNSQQDAIKISWVAPVEHDGVSSNGSTQILYNTPFADTSSLFTNGYTMTWQSEDGLCVMPEDFTISLQFMPTGNFFFDSDGTYHEEAVLISGETDDAEGSGNFEIAINKNQLVFTLASDISFTIPFYTNTTQEFVLTATGTAQTNSDYVWLDESTWNDDYFWTEGGTSIERVCNHWWKVQITNEGMKVEEVFPATNS